MRFSLALALALLPAPVMAEVPRVVTDIHPVHSLVSLVMGDLGQPALLLDKGANDHDFTLRPSQAAGLQKADLVVWIGPELTPWLDRALTGIGARADRLGLLALPGTVQRDYGADEDHEDDHGDHSSHDHDHTGLDPHAWLDPANAGVWLTAIAAELSDHDPANAATYAANAAAARDRIAALDAALAAELAPVKDKPFVVFHDAYGYFAGHYGLTVAGSVSLGDAAAPGAAHVQKTRAPLTGGKVLCAFPEAQHDPRLLTTLLDGTSVTLGGTLDPSGSSLEPGPQLYETLLRGMADTLAGCLN
ncbi:zinc ABC transporter substrate-binding protein [Gemmobacter sp.]|uniref:zinc ABC transporter substrate-binding protein n=1 Tax=Gemmobacter sp. TaxID=1898957 RepID=UPI002AFF60AD|nr:zinc ABC transporter substrate-binding protein [Gemmobacter sp.]